MERGKGNDAAAIFAVILAGLFLASYFWPPLSLGVAAIFVLLGLLAGFVG